jgi:transcriptional regulator with XRE-family HTH domain
MGMTQADLARFAGVRFQQIQKYECAANRTSAEVLWKLACALEVNVFYFYEGLPHIPALDHSQAVRQHAGEWLAV